MRRVRRLAALLCALVLCAAVPAGAAEIAISCGAVGQELALCREGATAWAVRTGHTVKVVSTPASATERLALYQQLLAAGAADVDVLQIDVVWPGMLATHLVDLTDHVSAARLAEQLPAAVEAGRVGDRLVALPWFIDVGLLYYRRDLLTRYGVPVPRTWGELTAGAALIQNAERAAGNAAMWGFVWQGRAYEGLTCNALEWIASSGGGTIVDAAGRVTVDNPNAVAAVALAAGWVGTISPRGVLNYQEEDARAVFQSGGAAFMRNWPYAWALANGPGSPVAGKVGVAPLPKGDHAGRPAAALGGQMLAVSRYSRNVDAAIDLVRYLTGAEEQRRRAIAGAFNPSFAALYAEPQVVAANPFFARLGPVIGGAVARPSRITGRRYGRVSNAFWNAVHASLSGNGDAAANLAALARTLERIGRGGRW